VSDCLTVYLVSSLRACLHVNARTRTVRQTLRQARSVAAGEVMPHSNEGHLSANSG
jgi:hypothetical protein